MEVIVVDGCPGGMLKAELPPHLSDLSLGVLCSDGCLGSDSLHLDSDSRFS